MESQEKCRTWVGNMYKKVGTFCSAIDNIVSQESLQYAEDQFLTAGANVKQFTENQFLTAGANVKQFCSEFMQEMLPEFLNDSSEEKSPEDTEKCDTSSCEILKKDDDEGHKDELSKSNSCNGFSLSGPSAVAKEMSLEHNRRKLILIPSDIPKVEASEKIDIGMTPSVCGVDQPNDGQTEDPIDLRRPKPVLSQPSYSSTKAGRTAEPEDAKVDSSNFHQYAIVSAAFDESKVPENEVPSSGIALSKALDDDSTDATADGKADQTKYNHINAIGMNTSEPLNMLTVDHQGHILSDDKICFSSDLEVEDSAPQAMDNSTLKFKFEKGWEFIQTSGDEYYHVYSDNRRGKSRKQTMQPRKLMSNNDHDLCESDWEIL